MEQGQGFSSCQLCWNLHLVSFSIQQKKTQFCYFPQSCLQILKAQLLSLWQPLYAHPDWDEKQHASYPSSIKRQSQTVMVIVSCWIKRSNRHWYSWQGLEQSWFVISSIGIAMHSETPGTHAASWPSQKHTAILFNAKYSSATETNNSTYRNKQQYIQFSASFFGNENADFNIS